MSINLTGSTSEQAHAIIDYLYSWYTSSGICYTKGIEYCHRIPFQSISETMRLSRECLIEIASNDNFRLRYLEAYNSDDEGFYNGYLGYIPWFLSEVCPFLKSIELDGQEELMRTINPAIEQFFRNYINEISLVKSAIKKPYK